MILVVTVEPPSLRLDEPQDLGRLHAVVDGPPSGLAAAVERLDGVVLLGDDLAVAPGLLRSLGAGRVADPGWPEQLGRTLEYARSKGWWDEVSGGVRVHVEREVARPVPADGPAGAPARVPPGRGRLAGKVALVTGTAGGQGRAAAVLFAREGAAVVGCDLSVEGDEGTAGLVRAEGGTMTVPGRPVDLSDPAQVQAWVDAAVAEHGRIDVLYNNASAPGPFTPVADSSPDAWSFTLRNELDLVFHACRAVWPHLVAAGGGSIVNTASGAALVGFPGGSAAHAATKAGVLGFTRQLAVEGGPHGIRVNALSPGVIDTPGTAGQLAVPGAREAMSAVSPLGRIGRPEDVAAAALFLAGDESSFVTGANLVVDGGWTATR